MSCEVGSYTKCQTKNLMNSCPPKPRGVNTLRTCSCEVATTLHIHSIHVCFVCFSSVNLYTRAYVCMCKSERVYGQLVTLMHGQICEFCDFFDLECVF